MGNTAQDLERRVRHTRDAVVRAFVQLAFDRRYDAIRTTELIEQSGVGRSTFYEHFRGKDAVLLVAMEPILVPLANAAAGRAGAAVLRPMIEHLWDRRSIGRIILDSTAASKLRRRLAAMIEARLALEGDGAIPLALPAMAAAAGQLAILWMWLAGEVSCSVDGMADQLVAFSSLALDRSRS